MRQLSSPFAGVAAATFAIAASAVCFGLVPLFARMLQGQGMDPAAVALWRFGLSGLVTAPFLPRRRAVMGQAGLLLGAGIALGMGWSGYMRAMEIAPVGALGVIYMTYPVFALLFAWALLGQQPGARSLGAAALVLGAAGLLWGGGALSVEVMLLALPAPVFFGLIIVVLSAMTPGLGALERVATGMLGSVLGLLPMVGQAGGGALLPVGAAGWGAVAALGVLTAVVPQVVYTLACPTVGPARAAAAGSFELPVMLAVGWLAFGEAIGLREAGAAVMVIGAIALAPAVRVARVAA